MAHRIIIALFAFGLLSYASEAQSWNKGSISGEGEVVTQEITLDALTGVNLGFSGNVILTQGSPQKIVMEGQQNILDNIKREVKNGTWNIVFDKSVHNAKDVTVRITMSTLKELGLGGSGSIKSTGKFTGLGDLDINLSGSGNITFEYEAQETDLNLSGSGEVDLAGSSKSLEIGISGSGEVDAPKLTTDDCEIHISGSGDASVHANQNLETHISGSGDVEYSGSASVTTRISGSGSVSKIK